MKTSLYYREGSSDKVYQVELAPVGGLFLVNFAFGRRGATLNTGSKTPAPVDEAKAKEIFARLVREKKAKGYTEGEDGTPYQHSPEAGRVTGHLPQLLNSIAEEELEVYLKDPRWCLQEKKDGKRMLIQSEGAAIHGINRRGLIVGLPSAFIPEIRKSQFGFVADGEMVGETFHVFDLLHCDGVSLLSRSYEDRLIALEALLAGGHLKHFVKIESAYGEEGKRHRLQTLKTSNAEGVVFKLLSASYRAGRPACGGSQLKFKFCADGAFVVKAVNPNRRSVALCLYDGERPVDVGNVTVPPNQSVPRPGVIVQVRYLYAFPESLVLFQPVYQWQRDDLEPQDCTLNQLKFKPKEADDDDQ